jgi:hypothetical protein
MEESTADREAHRAEAKVAFEQEKARRVAEEQEVAKRELDERERHRYVMDCWNIIGVDNTTSTLEY